MNDSPMARIHSPMLHGLDLLCWTMFVLQLSCVLSPALLPNCSPVGADLVGPRIPIIAGLSPLLGFPTHTGAAYNSRPKENVSHTHRCDCSLRPRRFPLDTVYFDICSTGLQYLADAFLCGCRFITPLECRCHTCHHLRQVYLSSVVLDCAF
jgi:hypothetical protein